jgi:DNA polymerase-1
VYCPDADFEAYYPVETDLERIDLKEAVFNSWNSATTVIAHNLKFDFHFMGWHPESTGWNYMDTTVLVHLLDSRLRKSLEKCETIFLGDTTKKYHVEEVPRKIRKKVWEWDIELIAPYCVNDCRVTYELAKTLTPQVDEWLLWNLFCQDMDYLNLLWEMERSGWLLDVEYIYTAKESLEDRLEILVQNLYDMVGYEFNWRSHQQLSKALYEDMGWEKPKNPFADADGVDRSRFADRGKYNSAMTSTFILMEKAHHPAGELISRIRETSKLLRSYIRQWLDLMDEDQMIHANFNLTGTRTGRLSSSKPNLQNLPSDVRGRFTQAVFSGETERTEEYNLRNAFKTHPGHSLVATDWKQMEMRMFGILSQDPFMLNSLEDGRDVHADIGEKVWGKRDKVHREWSKTISFGLIYGMTLGSVQFKLDMTRAEAKKITDQYWASFPTIRPWLFAQVDECKEMGYLRYWNGRIWKEDDPSYMYKGANAKIQGGCAGVLATAALRFRDWVEAQGHPITIVNLVHDEIIAHVPDELIPETSRAMKEIMRVPDLFDIEWTTDCKVGRSYGELKAWNVETGTFETLSEEEKYFGQTK